MAGRANAAKDVSSCPGTGVLVCPGRRAFAEDYEPKERRLPVMGTVNSWMRPMEIPKDLQINLLLNYKILLIHKYAIHFTYNFFYYNLAVI